MPAVAQQKMATGDKGLSAQNPANIDGDNYPVKTRLSSIQGDLI
jgi:hypothetical protein